MELILPFREKDAKRQKQMAQILMDFSGSNPNP